MSLRNIKKLQESPDFVGNTDDSEESEAAPRKQANNFELLSVSEREDDNETTEMENLSASNNIKSQKKKKNKKKRRTGAKQRVSSEDIDGDDEITRTVKLVDKMFGTTSQTPVPMETYNDIRSANATPLQKNILQVLHKNLNPQTELKRIFGKVVNQEQQKKRRGGNFRSMKPSLMTNPKDSWPPVNRSGIYMNLVNNPDNQNNKSLLFFSFEHSPSYRSVQQKFLQSVESIDSNNIVQIINMQPYHIDALIQLSELCKLSEDNSMAAELIEHAVYAYECAFHSMFNLSTGNCRLDYRRQENRGFFIVMFKHAQFLAARACPRTALELSKTILSLDPDNDPLAIILLIDFYAIRSKQFDFLVELYREWEPSHNLSLLPNMAYSYALALYHLNRLNEADEALQYALGMFPGVLKLLLEELPIQPDSRVSGHKYFSFASVSSVPPALQQLMKLYIARSLMLWSGDTEILSWIERNVHIVMDKVDAKDEIIVDFQTKRSSRYPTPPRNILRHVILSEFKEKVPLADFLKKETDPIVHFDPLPPLDSINIYENQKESNPQQQYLRSANGLQLFFESLFPSFSLQQPQGPNDVAQAMMANRAANADNADGAAGLANPEVLYRQSINSIVDAMRDLFSFAERHPNADGEAGESSTGEEDANDYLT